MSRPNHSGDRRYFDEHAIADDVWRVLRTASILGIGEFRVFEIAYHRWFGDYATEKTIEGFFVRYMFEDRIPAWVRAFCYHVLSEHNGGTLEPRHYGIKLPVSTREQRRRSLEHLFWISVGLAVLFFFCLLTPQANSFPPNASFPLATERAGGAQPTDEIANATGIPQPSEVSPASGAVDPRHSIYTWVKT